MNCPVCNKTFKTNNIIELNNSKNLLVNKKLQDRIDKLTSLGLYHNLKKRKMKRKKRINEDAGNDGNTNGTINDDEHSQSDRSSPLIPTTNPFSI